MFTCSSLCAYSFARSCQRITHIFEKEAQTLIFKKKSKDIPFEKWHENSDTALAHLHKALGMPVGFTVSPHFYYRAAQLPCKNAINMLVNNERSDREYQNLFTARKNPYEFDANFSTMTIPANLSE